MRPLCGLFRPGIRTKLLLLNLLVFLVFGIITALMFNAIETIRGMTTAVIHREVPRTIAVARLGRSLSQVFSQTNLLVSTFYGNDAILRSERARLAETTARLITRNPHPDLEAALLTFRSHLATLFDRCAAINDSLHQLSHAHNDVEARLAGMARPPDAASTDRSSVGLHVLSFREILLKARLAFLDLEPVLTDSRDTNAIFSLLNRLRRQLLSLAESGGEAARTAQDLLDPVLAYQNRLVAFNNRVIAFHSSWMDLERAMATAEAVLDRRDEETITTTRRLLENTRQTASASAKLVLLVSGVVVVGFVFFLYLFLLIHIRRPMATLVQGLRAIASGDLSTRIRLNRTDEWYRIEQALNDMVQKIGDAQIEQDRLHRQLLHAQKMEAVGTLAGGIAHEFNNLLQGIQGCADLLMRGIDPADPKRSKLVSIDRAVQRGGDLIQRLMTFARNVEGHLRPVNLNDEIRHVLTLLDSTFVRGVRIHFEPAPDLHAVHADPVQLEQVVMNLTVNAVDAMPDGGDLTLCTENRTLHPADCHGHPDARPGNHVVLTVSDTGIGMVEETIQNIYTPFFTTKSMGQSAGLGLAMVFGIVKEHGGHMTCTSAPGKGTTFQLFLPVLAPAAEGAASKGSERSA